MGATSAISAMSAMSATGEMIPPAREWPLHTFRTNRTTAPIALDCTARTVRTSWRGYDA